MSITLMHAYSRQESGKAVIKDCAAKFNQKPDVIRKVFYDLTDSKDPRNVIGLIYYRRCAHIQRSMFRINHVYCKEQASRQSLP